MNDLAWAIICLSLAGLSAYLWTRARRGPDPVRSSVTRQSTSDDHVAGLAQATARAEEILERADEGVLLLESDLSPIMANRAARIMLGLQEARLPARLPSEEVLDVARRATAGSDVEETLNVWFPLPMSLSVKAIHLENERGVLVLFRDVTQEVLAQKVRREFVSHASHELKSPVASLQALAEAVAEAVRNDPVAAARFSERLAVEADRLGQLVSDLLDLSRLEDPTNIPRESADLSEVARSEVRAQEKVARDKGIALGSRVGPGIRLRGDEQQLGLLIRNLLDNALRYTPMGGKVDLDVFRQEDDVYVRVTDDGPGIPLEAQGRVFERFYRVDRSRARDKGGTGLGLAIVKHVAEIHGGRVELQSDLGEGSMFTARLPAIQEEEMTDVSAGSIAG